MEAREREPSAAEWARLRASAPPEHAFLASSWTGPWAAHSLPGDGWQAPLRHMVCGEGSGCRAIYPFARLVRGGLPFLALAGPYAPFRGFPADPEGLAGTCAALAAAFRKRGGAAGLRLGPVRSGDPTAAAFLDALRAGGWRLHLVRESPEFLLDLPATEEEWGERKGKVSKKAAYYERRMGRAGEVRLETFEGADGAAWRRAFEAISTIEQSSWLATKGGDLHFSGEDHVAMWCAIAGNATAAPCFRAWVLFLDDAPVSHSLVLDAGPWRYTLANSYAESVADHRTGSILFSHMLLDAVRRGIRVVDLGEGDSGYKSLWGATEGGKLQDWVALRPGLAGRVLDLVLRWRARRG